MPNAVRGEVTILLEGKPRDLLPTYEALAQIESQCGAVVGLAFRVGSLIQPLTVKEMAVVVAETMRAAAIDKGDKFGKDVSVARIAELMTQGGIYQHIPVVEKILNHMVFGGQDPKKSEAASEAEAATASES